MTERLEKSTPTSSTVVFLGAGASSFCGIPTAGQLKSRILQKGGKDIQAIKRRFRTCSVPFNTETLLSFLESSSSRRLQFADIGPVVLGLVKGNLFNLRSVRKHRTLTRFVKHEIRNQCYVQKPSAVAFPRAELLRRYDFFLTQLMRNRRFRLSRQLPLNNATYPSIEFFTTNYDDVVETFFDLKGIPTIDGYADVVPPPGEGDEVTCRFNEREFDNPNAVRIYKLYGSIRYAKYKKRVWRIEPNLWSIAQRLGDLLIYPGATKIVWNEPQLQLFYRLHQRLTVCKRCIVIGYSFRDKAVADVFRNALALNPSLQVYVVSPDAHKIVKRVFHGNTSVKPIRKTFEKLDPAQHLR